MSEKMQQPAVEVIQRETTGGTDTPQIRLKRVAAYCRVSTDLEQQQSSLKLQMSSFRAQIEARPDWELADVYADNGVTGTQVEHRTEFLRMMDDCENGLVDYIITKSISRFARNTLECLSYVRHLKEKGIYIYFEKERLDTVNDTSEMLLSILAAVAQEESRNISENIKWNQRKRFAEGKAKWSAVYGYTKVGELEYLIDEDRAVAVRRIFAEYSHGRSLPEIIRRLAQAKIPSPWGMAWTSTVISKLLKNEKYCGDVLIQKSYTVDHLTHKRVWNDQAVVPSYYVRDHHKPIIDRKTFEMVQIILSLKDRHKGATQYPYYGKLVCPVCGGIMIRSCIQEHGHPPVWRCSQENSSDQCKSYFIKEKYIDQAFREAYVSLDTEALEKQMRRRDEAVTQAAQVARRFREELPQIDKVEYYLLDAMVEQMGFQKWDTLVIQWTFGFKSKVKIHYMKNRDIPNHEEQTESVGSRSQSRIENRQVGRCSHTSFERPNVYGYDSILTLPDGKEIL
ncbi:MAG: recombinase family protein [Saccharofermentanales bacterium]